MAPPPPPPVTLNPFPIAPASTTVNLAPGLVVPIPTLPEGSIVNLASPKSALAEPEGLFNI
jgi:hypothetical protein